MDNSTIHTDNVSILSVPYKESRPVSPSQIPLNPRLPAYTSRTNSPLRTALPLRHEDDYFTNRPPSRGAYRNYDMTPNYAPGYTPDEAYELNTIASQHSQRSYDRRDFSDSAHLLHNEGRGRSRDPTPTRNGYNGYN
jgi:hypothetical protein